MPKIVDPAERRALIADALFRVIVRDGVGGVSLRNVAAEANVTAGMVQHYFASKDELMAFAMQTAATRYEQRIGASVAALGEAPSPAAVVRAVLLNFIPQTDDELHDGRISLQFQAYAAIRDDHSRSLAQGEAQLRHWFTELLEHAADADAQSASARATALLATAEGLGLTVLSAGLSASDALAALDAQLIANGIR
ncbi:TetR family transcriptional regulator [Microbacterium esteraromaticum]|uniref:TetR family transcriptional regulator n=1 Tax=Microbacterium esteraromaticum TaxID=57043 RepID=A0A7D7W833_9MICO|nr:TetR family transcriptional regulator [Microbacterium esteraromaticum]QMU97256.1 TetR family transcriptional regulator [Microbacterium esteraromaticum]